MKDKPIRSKLTRGSRPEWMSGTGPYLGKIVNHLDSEYMGMLEVEILKIFESGTPEESSGYIIPCAYVSPFYGVSPRAGVKPNDGFDNTQKSYGMWAIPPDIGVKVIVLMLENNYGYGYWIGCVQDRYMNFMVPGNASTTYNDVQPGKVRPVGEYNKSNILSKPSGKGTDPTQFEKSINDDHLAILENQGLVDDQTRGTNTSSARREVPSMVFGWSTPGILDRRPGKNKTFYGEVASKTLIPFSRLGGSSFVMDDGDDSLHRKGVAKEKPPEYANFEKGDTSGNPTIPHNELSRWRTRTGHQILLHNSEDLIYIGNAQGSTWIELTSNGKIDIYAKDSISIHSENDINFKAKKDINIEASGNINIKSREQMRLESGNATHWKVGTAEVKKDPALRPELGIKNEDGTWKWNSFEDLPTVEQPGDNLYIDVSRDVYWKVGTHPNLGDFKLEVSQDGHTTFDRDFFLLAKENIHQHSNKATFHLADTTFDQKAGDKFFQESAADMNLKSGANMKILASSNAVVKASNNFITASSANHVKAGGTNYITAGGTNEYNAPTNNMSQIQNFGSGSATGSDGASADSATDAQDALLPECAHHTFIPIRIPLHEPWLSHENLQPEKFYRDLTDSTKSIKDDCIFSKDYEQEEIQYVIVPDTFRKGN